MDSLFEDDLVEEYIQWKKTNTNFSWWNYVNLRSDVDVALAFSKFYCPDIIIIDNCFLLKDKYNKSIYDSWRIKCSNKTDIEKMMNLYELEDFFHINQPLYNSNYSLKIRKLGEIIQYFWSLSFRERFKDREIIVDVFDQYGDNYVTVYEKIE